jgi:hypothetical protein
LVPPPQRGDFIVTGTTDYRTSRLDIITVKYSGTEGRVLLERHCDGPTHESDEPTALALDRTGDIVITGRTGFTHSETNGDLYVAKYDGAMGLLSWERRYNSPANLADYGVVVTVATTGDVYATGLSETRFSHPQHYTAKYAGADGALLWERTLDAPEQRQD